ncbi:MAG: HipA domain-containing protein [Acidiferrobacterales bacterium]
MIARRGAPTTSPGIHRSHVPVVRRRARRTKAGLRRCPCAVRLEAHRAMPGTVEDLFRMIEHFVPSGEQAAARRDLFSRLLLNDVLRNGDAHLKNFGLVYDDLSRPRLSPVYDVLTTQAWIRNDLPALRMGSGDAGPQWLTESSLDRLAGMARVPEAARQLVASFKEVAVHAMRSVLDLDIARVNPVARVALERASQVVQGAWMHRES